MQFLQTLEVTERDGKTAIFCLQCQRPVDEYELKFGSEVVQGPDGYGQRMLNGKATLIVRCHGAEFRVDR